LETRFSRIPAGTAAFNLQLNLGHRRRYFHTMGHRHWVFAARVSGDRTENRVVLHSMSHAPIKRHIRIRAGYNPYDPEWELYGETLRQNRMSDQMQHRREWSKLYKSQRGRCALCDEPITKDTGWHDHHIEYRLHGGSNALSNRVLLHPVCHQRLHIHGLSVVKPAYENEF
ncbi:MAG: HNH endonuclease signature motif containing protein, partial [Burkholderia gladioli]